MDLADGSIVAMNGLVGRAWLEGIAGALKTRHMPAPAGLHMVSVYSAEDNIVLLTKLYDTLENEDYISGANLLYNAKKFVLRCI
jgi:hypothetical protein